MGRHTKGEILREESREFTCVGMKVLSLLVLKEVLTSEIQQLELGGHSACGFFGGSGRPVSFSVPSCVCVLKHW